jgi:putative PIN family toxin of toxin-antitoxin system
MRVVLDANVVISALITPQGAMAQVLDFWKQGVYELVLSPAILDEIARVAHYPRIQGRYRLDDAEIDEFIRLLGEEAMLIQPSFRVQAVAEDPDDDRYVECALAAGADLIVTGDAHLLKLGDYQGIRMTKPGDFLLLLRLLLAG